MLVGFFTASTSASSGALVSLAPPPVSPSLSDEVEELLELLLLELFCSAQPKKTNTRQMIRRDLKRSTVSYKLESLETDEGKLQYEIFLIQGYLKKIKNQDSVLMIL